MKEKIIDLRSDTVTMPSDAMREAMASAEVGDDVLGEDPTVHALEAEGAKLLGKEACLFTVSGTMSNLLAVLCLTQPGEQAILHSRSHLYNLEVASLARICGVMARPLDAPEGIFDLAVLRENLMDSTVQTARTSLVCLENTFDLNQGLVVHPAHMEDVAALARGHGAGVFLDGARLLNAAIALNAAPATLCQQADMVSLCLSKGLGCPVGSLLAGTRAQIDKARQLRQALGGGWRQAGILAAAGILALRDYSHLKADHANAKRLGYGLAALGFDIDSCQVQTNIVLVSLRECGVTAYQFADHLRKEGILVKALRPNAVRLVTHLGIGHRDVEATIEAFRTVKHALA